MYDQGTAATRTPLEATAYHLRQMPEEWRQAANERFGELIDAHMDFEPALMLSVDETMIVRLISDDAALKPDQEAAGAEAGRAVAALRSREHAPAAVYATYLFGEFA